MRGLDGLQNWSWIMAVERFAVHWVRFCYWKNINVFINILFQFKHKLYLSDDCVLVAQW